MKKWLTNMLENQLIGKNNYLYEFYVARENKKAVLLLSVTNDHVSSCARRSCENKWGSIRLNSEGYDTQKAV